MGDTTISLVYGVHLDEDEVQKIFDQLQLSNRNRDREDLYEMLDKWIEAYHLHRDRYGRIHIYRLLEESGGREDGGRMRTSGSDWSATHYRTKTKSSCVSVNRIRL